MSKKLVQFILVVVLVSCILSTASAGSVDFWTGDVATNIARSKDGSYCPIREFNVFVNDLFIPESISKYLHTTFGENGGYYATTYLRDLITGTVVYWLTAGAWHVCVYNIFVKKIFVDEKRPQPSAAIMIDSMILAQSSIFMYVALPVFSTFLIENKLTMTYFYVDEVGGWAWYFAWLVVYMVFVEVGIYWMHRVLHTNKTLYKYIHSLHHKYNSAVTLTPWASIAFHPVDGCLQASPYVICLFFIPCNYYTHVFLVFFSAVWATNIHDSTWGDTEPIMGSKYHLLHHTHYHYNYGQYFIFCDYLWGTLRLPQRSLLNPTPLGGRVSKEAQKLSEFNNDTSDDVMLKVATEKVGTKQSKETKKAK